MKGIKGLLLRVLGEEKYLFFLSGIFRRLFKTGLLGKEYQDIYFLKNFIKQRDVCVDIGAHLGYYTFQLSKLVGKEGKVIGVEPVGKFHNVLQKTISNKQYNNIELRKLALGAEGEFVEIGIPRINKQKKFGYARIKQMHEYLEYAETEIVPNINGDELLKDLKRLDFIKCDVEGAEVPVFSSMPDTLAKHTPILLCELADKEERIKMYEMLKDLAYEVYLLKRGKLHLLDVYSEEKAISHNHYFIPSLRLKSFEGLILQ